MRLFFFFLLGCFCITTHADESAPTRKFENHSSELSTDRIIDFLGYENYKGNDQFSDALKIRFYNPIDLDSWRGRMRLDTSLVSNYSSSDPANNSGQFSAGNTMLTVWGQDKEILNKLNATIGARVIFPFGNNGQWAIGPQLGWVFKPTQTNNTPVSDLSPTLRYMYGFDTKSNTLTINPSQPPLQRNLQIYPTIGFQIAPDTQIRFWDENGVIFNSAGGSWFVPIDLMLTHRLTEHFLFAVGASKQIVDTYKQYDWSLYSKLSFNF